MESAHFDEFFFAIDDVPFFGSGGTVDDVAGAEVVVAVEGLGIGAGIVEVAADYDGAADAELAGGVVGGYVSTGVVDDSVVISVVKGYGKRIDKERVWHILDIQVRCGPPNTARIITLRRKEHHRHTARLRHAPDLIKRRAWRQQHLFQAFL